MKLKPIVYIVAFLLLSSCSRSIYYAFEKEGTYSTLEEKKNGDVIYRAISKEHYFTERSGFKNYIYLYSPISSNNIYTGIGTDFILMFIENLDPYTENTCTTNNQFNPDKNIIHYSKKNRDSLDLLTNLKTELGKEPCFIKHKITWFPPYLKKVKKIDYKKFNLPLKEKYLKTMADKDK